MKHYITRRFISYRYEIRGVSGHQYFTDPITWDAIVLDIEVLFKIRTGEAYELDEEDVIRYANTQINDVFNFSNKRNQATHALSNRCPLVLNPHTIESIMLSVRYPDEQST